MKAKQIVLMVLFLFFLLGGVFYLALASFSEHREYEKFSIDYWLLNPTEISSIATFCQNEPNFIYSAADGAKPLVVQLKCIASGKEVARHLEQAGFAQNDAGIYKKAETQIELELDAGGKMIAATLLMFL